MFLLGTLYFGFPNTDVVTFMSARQACQSLPVFWSFLKADFIMWYQHGEIHSRCRRMCLTFWTWILPILAAFGSNELYNALLLRPSLYPKAAKVNKNLFMHFIGLVVVPMRSSCQYVYNVSLPAIDFSFFMSILIWILALHLSFPIEPPLLAVASSFHSLLSGWPTVPKDLSLIPVRSSSFSFNPCQ